ncbi:hypothetical protein [Longimicrobium terrae]|uniref:Uncharacterized protein n=1 Tax=Longimicrobium terrae TaxID=1639882 RepID=A0A841GKC8_9BACT|nr:hypothetical protein [Longimicrobium terrae]MBB4634063.1 hypothetical protein [Longimicrobium terrae]MBB6069047.1 hypothetical protein [Longimicrobium terrae]NNC28224.1 hypothetical protein [Longimicrobium terrae]
MRATKEVTHVETTGTYDVSTGIMTEVSTYYYSDGSFYTETRTVDTHQPGWESNAND